MGDRYGTGHVSVFVLDARKFRARVARSKEGQGPVT